MLTDNVNRIWRCGTALGASLLDRRPTVAYVAGWLGKKNLGDEALFAAYRTLFPQLSLLPFEGGRLISGLGRRLPLFRAGIIAGGTLISEQREHLRVIGGFTEQHPRFVIFGTGVESAQFWPGEDTLPKWKRILGRAAFVGVRGPISAQILRDAGVSDIEVVGDPVVTFARTAIHDAPERATLGLNLGVTDGRLWGGSEERVRDQLVGTARLAVQSGWKVRWFVVWPNDLPITREAAAASGTADDIIEVYEDHEEMISHARRLTAFAGMKLHATVLSTCALTPSVMLEYRPKCRDYMQSIGQDHLTIDTGSFTAEQLWSLVTNIASRRAEMAASVRRGVNMLQTRQRDRARAVADLLLHQRQAVQVHAA